MATMNIKDPRVRELARELAVLRGSSATAAVRAALEEALAQERSRRGERRARLARLQESVASTKAEWLEVADLYDDEGSPR